MGGRSRKEKMGGGEGRNWEGKEKKKEKEEWRENERGGK